MSDTIMENSILNSPYREPDRHWRFTGEGITNEIVEGQRHSAYFGRTDLPGPPSDPVGHDRRFNNFPTS